MKNKAKNRRSNVENEKRYKVKNYLSFLKIPLIVALVGSIIYAIAVMAFVLSRGTNDHLSLVEIILIFGTLVLSTMLILPLSLGDMLYVLRYNAKGEKTELKTKLNNYITVCDVMLLIYFVALHFTIDALSVLLILAGVYFALRAVYLGITVFGKHDGEGQTKDKVKRVFMLLALLIIAIVGAAYLLAGTYIAITSFN